MSIYIEIYDNWNHSRGQNYYYYPLTVISNGIVDFNIRIPSEDTWEGLDWELTVKDKATDFDLASTNFHVGVHKKIELDYVDGYDITEPDVFDTDQYFEMKDAFLNVVVDVDFKKFDDSIIDPPLLSDVYDYYSTLEWASNNFTHANSDYMRWHLMIVSDCPTNDGFFSDGSWGCGIYFEESLLQNRVAIVLIDRLYGESVFQNKLKFILLHELGHEILDLQHDDVTTHNPAFIPQEDNYTDAKTICPMVHPLSWASEDLWQPYEFCYYGTDISDDNPAGFNEYDFNLGYFNSCWDYINLTLYTY